MKRLLLAFVLITAFTISYAQDRSKEFSDTQMYFKFPVTSIDSISLNDSIWYAQVFVNKPSPVKTDVKITIDELSGLGGCTASLQGKKFEGDAWSNITTVTYHSVGSDTTFTISDGTARLYRYFRMVLDKAGTGKSEVDLLEFKFWYTY